MGFLKKYYNDKQREEVEVLTIGQSYMYWCEMLFDKTMRIFNWHNLPNNIPQKEIEMRLLLEGFCGFVDDRLKGLMIASGSLNGVTQYFDEFTNFTYSAPLCYGGSPLINKECVIINNTQIRNGLYGLICRYASLLSHAEISLKCALVNLREVNTFTSTDDGTAENIQAYHDKCYEGKTDVIVDSSLIDGIKNISNSPISNDSIMSCIDARNEILRAFFNEIGVKYSRDKKERMITSEVANDNQMLLINIKDMLKERQEACERINKLFNLNVSVELSNEFKIIEVEEKQ